MMLGLVAIGHSPRPDFERAFRRHAGQAEIRLVGALDGLSASEVRGLASAASEYPLLVRLADGTSAEVPLPVLVPRVATCAERLASEGARLIVVLCAGAFPTFPCPAPVLLPGRLVPAVVGSLTGSRRVGVVVPVRGQVAAARTKWAADGFDAVVTWASPVSEDEIDAAARAVSDPALELVVLDCMGHDEPYRQAFARRCGRPVVLAQSLVARVAGELVASGGAPARRPAGTRGQRRGRDQ
jgi:protein AroM